MRISDWSSDVCSSDLRAAELERLGRRLFRDVIVFRGEVGALHRHLVEGRQMPVVEAADAQIETVLRGGGCIAQGAGIGEAIDQRARSEEHTSELQSLMRISYAVLCLKKKNNRHKSDT